MEFDDTDLTMLDLLQADGRISVAEMARKLHLSHSTIAERLRRLRDRGVLQGVRAEVNLKLLGYEIEAVVRVSTFPHSAPGFLQWVRECPYVLWCTHVMGEDCFVLHLACQSVSDLEGILGKLGTYGSTASSLVLSTPVDRRGLNLGAAAKANVIADHEAASH